MNQEYMKTRKILPLVLSMSLPMVISMAVNALYNIVDSYFVAKISEDAMTALALVFPVQNLVNAIVIGFAIGINARVAFYLGAKEEKLADESASVGLLLNLIHGLVLALLCSAIMPSFLRMFTGDTQVIALACTYSTRVFAFAPVIGLELAYEKIFQAVGRMKVSMICMMLGCVTNIILDPVMIFGLATGTEAWNCGCGLCHGNRSVCDAGGVSAVLFCTSDACKGQRRKYEDNRKRNEKYLYHRNSGNFKSCTSFHSGVRIKCNPCAVSGKLYSGARSLL